jgi:hypothetical protein
MSADPDQVKNWPVALGLCMSRRHHVDPLRNFGMLLQMKCPTLAQTSNRSTPNAERALPLQQSDREASCSQV